MKVANDDEGYMQHNHVKKLNALIEAGLVNTARGTLQYLRVEHDDDCWAIQTGFRKRCNCAPDIYLNDKKLELPK